MAFASKVGNIVKQAINSKPSLLQAVRCMSSSKLFVGGLSYGTDDQSFREAFANYGEVVEARIIIDRETGRSRGFGFITFTSSEEASAAITAMDGKDLHGRMIRVNHANDRGGGGFRGGYGGGGGGGYGGGGYGGGAGGYGGGYGGGGDGYAGSGDYSGGGSGGGGGYGGAGAYDGGNNGYTGGDNYGSGGGGNAGYGAESGGYGGGGGGGSYGVAGGNYNVPGGGGGSDNYAGGATGDGHMASGGAGGYGGAGGATGYGSNYDQYNNNAGQYARSSGGDLPGEEKIDDDSDDLPGDYANKRG